MIATFGGSASLASDHADPTWLPANRAEANLTDLFFFPDGDRYVAILNARPTLTAPPPYKLKPYTYEISIDTRSAVRFPAAASAPGTACRTSQELRDDVAAQPYSAEAQQLNGDCLRYGGTVADPAGIRADVSMVFALENDATLRAENVKIEGLRPTPVFVFDDLSLAKLRRDPARYADAIIVYAGVRDDPFIFPRFFNANAVSIVVSIPKSAFATTSQDWLLWGASRHARNGKKIDHVGRSNRTQVARFDVLNTKEPGQHLKVLRDVTAFRVKVQDFLKEVVRPASNLNQLSGFLLRGYDYAPDVMIFTTRHPPGFPNGRLLTDDVARITCENGDCPLLENSYIDSRAFPRAIRNDKPFLTEFPYLAPRWPYRPQPFVGSPWHYFRAHLLWPLIIILTALLAFSVWRRWACKRLAIPKTRPGESR